MRMIAIGIMALLFVAKNFALEWAIIKHPLAIDKLKEGMAEMWNKGFYPFGIEVAPQDSPYEGAYVLYLKEIDFLYFNKYDIRLYTSLEKALADMEERQYFGWIAKDVAYTPKLTYMLYFKKTGWLKGYEKIATNLDSEGLETCFNGERSNNNLISGITGNEGNTVFFLMRKPEMEWKAVWLQSYPMDDELVREGLDNATALGYIPWSLSISSNQMEILYIK